MEMINPNRIPLLVKIGYSGIEGAYSIIWSLFYIFFLFFMTDVVKMSPATAGFILMVATMWSAVVDPVVGILSDTTTLKWGRRRPFILIAAIPTGLAAWLLFTDFKLGPSMTIAYYIVVVILYYTVSAFLYVPYAALAPEMTQDYDERTSLISFRAGCAQIACIIGASLPLVLAKYLGNVFGSIRLGWSSMSAIFGLICIPASLLTWRVTRGYELFPEKISIGMRDIFTAALKNRPFLYTMGIYSFSVIALNIASSSAVYFMKYYMSFSEEQSSLTFFILFACSLFWIPFIGLTSVKWGKRWAFNIFIGVWALIQCLGMLVIKPGSNMLFYILIFFASGGVVSVYMLGWAMIPDVTEVDEFKTGQRREGLYYGIASFVQKSSLAIALWLVGIIISFMGYHPQVVQTKETLFGIRLLYFCGTALFLIISIILCYLMPLTRERHEALRVAIRSRKEGKPYDLEALKGIL